MQERSQSHSLTRLVRALIITLLTAAVIYVLGQVSQVARRFLDILLLFGMAWLVSFLLSPVINYFTRHPIPSTLVNLLRGRLPPRVVDGLDRFRLPHTLAVVLVYLGVLVALTIFSVVAIPAIVTQLVDLGRSAPDLIRAVPDLVSRVQEELAARGIEINIGTLYQPNQLMQRAEAFGAQIVQQAFALATGLASILVSILMMLTISLYMNLDGPRLARQLHAVIPDHFHGRLNLLGQSISRTFGGFMRGQLLLAGLYGVPATLVLMIAGVGLSVVIGILCSFLMLIPLIGAPIAMVLPALVALAQRPDSALWILIVMTVYQQILLQVLAPRVMADVLGMPSLLALMAILLSTRIVGFWGLVFGLPVFGVLYALAVTYLEQSKISQETLPRGVEDSEDGRSFLLAAMGPGCLLVPEPNTDREELRHIGRYLAARGITCLGVDPFPPTLDNTWETWYSAVLLGLDRLWRECSQVFLIGKGVGALLALHAASELPVAGVAAVSPPLTRDGRYPQPERTKPGVHNPAPLVHPSRLPGFRTQVQATHLQDRVHSELASATCPVLLVEARYPDTTAENMRYILERLGTPHKRIEWLDPADTSELRDATAQAAYAFFRRYFR